MNSNSSNSGMYLIFRTQRYQLGWKKHSGYAQLCGLWTACATSPFATWAGALTNTPFGASPFLTTNLSFIMETGDKERSLWRRPLVVTTFQSPSVFMSSGSSDAASWSPRLASLLVSLPETDESDSSSEFSFKPNKLSVNVWMRVKIKWIGVFLCGLGRLFRRGICVLLSQKSSSLLPPIEWGTLFLCLLRLGLPTFQWERKTVSNPDRYREITTFSS